jgi:hypothetical protein
MNAAVLRQAFGKGTGMSFQTTRQRWIPAPAGMTAEVLPRGERNRLSADFLEIQPTCRHH